MLSDFLISSLNKEQKEACIEENNTVTAAGAGSGKTRVLATRVAYLVIEKNIPINRILTLTFTKKAVTEMYSRIYDTLAKAAANFSIAETARQRAQNAIDHFAEAAIQTMDSFSSSIVRIAGRRYGISPDFSSGNKFLESTIKTEALSFVMDNRQTEAVQKLCPPGEIENFASSLFANTIINNTSIADNSLDFFTSNLDKQIKEICIQWNSIYHDKIADYIMSIQEEFASLSKQKLSEPYGQKIGQIFSSGEPEYPTASIENFTTKEFRTAVIKYNKWLNSFNFKQVSGYTINLRKKIARIKGNSNEKGLLEDFNPIAEYILKFPLIQETFALLDNFLKKMNTLKRTSGLLSFADISSLALKIIKEQKDIRNLEKESFDAIMIDEFQDNNEKNKELLYFLAEKKNLFSEDVPNAKDLEPNKLFFVGDEKQSIYQFRGADVSVFNKLSQELGGERKVMRTNYRSSPELISIFNIIFGGFKNGDQSLKSEGPSIFPATNENLQPFQASFTKNSIALSNSKKQFLNTNHKSPLHICLLDINLIPKEEDDPVTKQELEAFFVAEKIQALLLEKNNKNTSIKLSDIAILLKSTTHQEKFEKQLRLHGIPYVSEKLVNFFNEAPLNDLYNFLRLIVYPSDMIAYASLLTSPFISLSREEAETIISINNNKPFNADNKEKIKTAVSPESFQNFNTAANIFFQIQTFALSQKVTETITKLWYELGYRYETLWNKTVSLYEEQYDLIFETARQADNESKGVAWFIDQLAAQKNTIFQSNSQNNSELDTKDLSYPVERLDAVHIMTIHKSKGLEFPIVFVCNVIKSKKKNTSSQNKKYIFCDEKGNISLNTSNTKLNYFFKKQEELQKLKTDAELRRLLYVAITRAEQEVFITGSWDGKDKLPDYVASISSQDPSLNIYDLLEPILSYYSSQNSNIPETDIPYQLEEILYHSRYDINFPHTVLNQKDTVQGFIKNTNQEKQAFIKTLEPIYNQAQIQKTPIIEKPYIRPSDLEQHFFNNFDYEETNNAPYQEINKIIERYSNNSKIVSTEEQEKKSLINQTNTFTFNPENFGTIVHAYMESLINRIPLKNFSISEKETAALTGQQGLKDIETIKNICVSMGNKFKNSEIGKEVFNSKEYFTEYAFKSAIGKKIIRGTIDTFFRSKDNNITIIDYKTDQTILPEKHYTQMACYRQALHAIFNIEEKNIRSILFYLRYGKAIDITKLISNISVTEILLDS